MTVFGAATSATGSGSRSTTHVAIAVALANGPGHLRRARGRFGLVPLVASTTAVSLASYGAYAWTGRNARFPEPAHPAIRLSAVRSFAT